MKARKAAPIGVLILLIGVAGCGSTPLPRAPSSTGSSASSITISPTSALIGSSDVQLTITGSNFDGAGVIQSEVVWSANGSDTFLPKTFVSSTHLTAVIPAAFLSGSITAQVFVEKWDRIEGVASARSNPVAFQVTSSSSPSTGSPSISSISPTNAVAGSPDLTLTITGENFANANNYHSYVAWSVNGSYSLLATTVINGSQLTAVVPAALLTKTMTATVSVQTWYKADDTPRWVSNSVSFDVNSSLASAELYK